MDLQVVDFIIERLNEGDPTLETRKGTAFYDLFIKPQEFMLQPFTTAMNNILIAQSVKLILAQTDPDSYDSAAVDDLAGNVYVDRDAGAYATCSCRVFYNLPVDREWPALSTQFTGQGSNAYFNATDFSITASEMALNVSGNYFYLDVIVRAQALGANYNAALGDITAIVNDADAVTVTNTTVANNGVNEETNTQLLNRIPKSIAVRDLETEKGITAILQENFPYLTEIQSIGMGDPEMQRDIFYNIHCGAYTDVYIKTPALQQLSTNIVGLVFDTTRILPVNIHLELLAESSTDPLASLNTPNIVPSSLTVQSDTISSAGSALTGHATAGVFDLSTTAEFIKIQVDNSMPINVRVVGSNPASTQIAEIINAINSVVGIAIASKYGSNQILIQSPTIGLSSQIIISEPDAPRTSATSVLFPGVTLPAVYSGGAPTVYIEDVDYKVDYTNGLLWRLGGSAITSGDTILGPLDNGSYTTGSSSFTCPTSNAFENVSPGDELIINSVSNTHSGIVPGTYVITAVTNNNTLKILDFNPVGSDEVVNFSIVSTQVVVVNFSYNPLSVDVGPLVLLSDGVTRGIREGRSAYTITDVAFLSIISIQEIDPNTLTGLGTFLNAPGGFGSGGFGNGGFGQSVGGDYDFIVLDPPTRFSSFEDSLIVFDPSLFGRSYQITYYAAPEIATIHALCRNDLERVTGADVLPKNFVPIFVDMTITVAIPANLANSVTTTTLTAGITALINGTVSNTELDASAIVEYIGTQGVKPVVLPFNMTGTIINTDGSTTILIDPSKLIAPTTTLPSQTSNYVTPRITQFYARNITVLDTNGNI